MGVRPIYRHFKHDGATGPNMATVYSDRGFGVRPPVVFYNRANEAAAQLKPGDFDWKAIFAGGVRWVHCGGIFAALSPTTAQLAAEMMREAKAAGAVTSFDLNFREKLWKIHGGDTHAVETIGKIVENVDVLVGNEEDLQLGLGLKGPDVESHASKLDPSAFFGMMGEVTKVFPNIRMVATTLREVHSVNRHSWGAVVWLDGKTYVSPTCELDVVCRIGGGDGFAAGLFNGFLTGQTPEQALRQGWAHGALLTTTPGDTSMVTLEQVMAVAGGGSARVQR
jgi:2-dehydro-3-deoxygluconokinase